MIFNGIFITNWRKHRNGAEVSALLFFYNDVTPFACHTAGEETTVQGNTVEDALSHAAFRETLD